MGSMSLDPLALCLFVLTFLKFGGNLEAAQGEVNAYMNLLAIAVSLFQKVEATHLATTYPRRLRARIDKQLKEIGQSLHDASSDVGGVMRNTKDPHLRLLGNSDALAWTLKYRDIANANKGLLQVCINELHQIERELEKAGATCHSAVEYFKATRTETWSVLSEKVARRATLYEGIGEQYPSITTMC